VSIPIIREGMHILSVVEVDGEALTRASHPNPHMYAYPDAPRATPFIASFNVMSQPRVGGKSSGSESEDA
jgi:hypothetical protein